QRDGFGDFLSKALPVTVDNTPQTTAHFNELTARFHQAIQTNTRTETWRLVKNGYDVSRCERSLLNSMGKSQDGLISRFLNRPLSRRLSRVLLRYDVAPTALTMYAFILPFLAFLCLAADGYAGILAGAILFQIYSI